MGGLFGGKTTTKNKSEPWKPQGDALKGAISSATDIYGKAKDTPFYQGDLYAGMDPATREGITGVIDYSKTGGQQAADTFTNAGQALADPGAFRGAIDRFSASAGADPTQGNIAAATAYANNPATDGMIDAASRDVRRNLYEDQLPGINRAAAGSGNTNSSRAGVASGIAERGAADRVGDISAAIRGDAYNRGLAMAEGARTSNMSAQGQTAGLYGQALGQGLDAVKTGNDLNFDNLDAQIRAGQLSQADAQGQIEAEYKKWEGDDQRQSEILERYYKIIGANNWGGTSTTTQKTSGNILGTIAGLGMSAAGLGLFGGGKK
jgi:hypothetical protein